MAHACRDFCRCHFGLCVIAKDVIGLHVADLNLRKLFLNFVIVMKFFFDRKTTKFYRIINQRRYNYVTAENMCIESKEDSEIIFLIKFKCSKALNLLPFKINFKRGK